MVQAKHTDNTFDYTALEQALAHAESEPELFHCIVNEPFAFKVETAMLFLGIIVLLLVDKDTKTINRVALSQTELAQNTTAVSAKRFQDIRIPLDYSENMIAKAIMTGEPQEVTDWTYLFNPELTPEEAQLNQASGGIAYSAIYPLTGAREGGAMIFSYYQYVHEIGDPQHNFMKRYSQLVQQALTRPM